MAGDDPDRMASDPREHRDHVRRVGRLQVHFAVPVHQTRDDVVHVVGLTQVRRHGSVENLRWKRWRGRRVDWQGRLGIARQAVQVPTESVERLLLGVDRQIDRAVRCLGVGTVHRLGVDLFAGCRPHERRGCHADGGDAAHRDDIVAQCCSECRLPVTGTEDRRHHRHPTAQPRLHLLDVEPSRKVTGVEALVDAMSSAVEQHHQRDAASSGDLEASSLLLVADQPVATAGDGEVGRHDDHRASIDRRSPGDDAVGEDRESVRSGLCRPGQGADLAEALIVDQHRDALAGRPLPACMLALDCFGAGVVQMSRERAWVSSRRCAGHTPPDPSGRCRGRCRMRRECGTCGHAAVGP